MPSLFNKRKFSREDDDHCDYAPAKQLKLATAPASTSYDDEVAMNDVSIIPFPRFSSHNTSSSQLSIATTNPNASPNYYHSRLPSGISPTATYPRFELYPEVETPMDVDNDTLSSLPTFHHQHTDSQPGLLQPSNSTALQHGQNCSTIPRLRMSSYPDSNGRRSMWSHCENCGACELVKA